MMRYLAHLLALLQMVSVSAGGKKNVPWSPVPWITGVAVPLKPFPSYTLAPHIGSKLRRFVSQMI